MGSFVGFTLFIKYLKSGLTKNNVFGIFANNFGTLPRKYTFGMFILNIIHSIRSFNSQVIQYLL